MFLGSHSLPLSIPGREILDSTAIPPVAQIRNIPEVFAASV
jgi:hypothetical protein